MKYLSIFLLLISGALSAQTSFNSLKAFNENAISHKMELESMLNPQELKINFPNQSILEQQNFQSDLKLFSPQSLNLSSYPMTDLSNMDEFILGTSVSNTVNIGSKKIQTTYIFDVIGNLKSSQTSFSFGRK